MAEEIERLERYAQNLQQDVIAAADLEGSENLRPHAFTERMISELVDTGDLEDGSAVYHRARGLEVSGYATADDDLTLDLFATIYTGAVPPVSVPKGDVEVEFKRLLAFFDRATHGYHNELEEASPVFDMCLRIYNMRARVRRLRLFCFTDGLTGAKFALKGTSGDVDRSLHVWDIRRLFRAATSGAGQARIEIDFVRRFGAPLQCLTDTATSEYRSYLAIVPGSMLAALYGEFGSRLLEFNVRSFLQARGKVNKGIRKTLLEQPRRFLAYNNGISATASEVTLASNNGGAPAIAKLKDLQIVNGGQTTASLYHASKSDGADLGAVGVQMKLTVVEPEMLQSFVPLISRYANTQNKVNEADFAANDTYHIQLEELSRTIWAPAASGTQRQTKWFYERARGQYQDMLASAETRAKREQLRSTYPTDQKFTKTDLAKFENTWSELPHLVSLGAEKNFREFVLRLGEAGPLTIEEGYFERLIGRVIVFRRAEKLVGDLKLGGYRANVVTYTLALIHRRTDGLLDLDRIWRSQSIGPGLSAAISVVAPFVFEAITSQAAGRNVTEWCKRPECWQQIAALDVVLPGTLYQEVGTSAAALSAVSKSGAATMNTARVMATSEATWRAIATWGRSTRLLLPWKCSLASTLARIVADQRRPTSTQALHGVLVLDEANRRGFAEA